MKLFEVRISTSFLGNFEVTLHRIVTGFLEVIDDGNFVNRISWPIWYSVQPNFTSANLSLVSEFRKSTEAAKKMSTETGLDSMLNWKLCSLQVQITNFSVISWIDDGKLAVRHSKEFFFQGMPFQGMPQQGKFFPRNATTRNATPRKNFSKECRFQGIFIINH